MDTETPGFGVIVTGEICPHGALQEALLHHDVTEFIAPAASLFAGADLVIGNLEISLCKNSSPIRKFGASPHFMPKPAIAAALNQMGFGVLTLANNYIMDQGICYSLGSKPYCARLPFLSR